MDGVQQATGLRLNQCWFIFKETVFYENSQKLGVFCFCLFWSNITDISVFTSGHSSLQRNQLMIYNSVLTHARVMLFALSHFKYNFLL